MPPEGTSLSFTVQTIAQCPRCGYGRYTLGRMGSTRQINIQRIQPVPIIKLQWSVQLTASRLDNWTGGRLEEYYLLKENLKQKGYQDHRIWVCSMYHVHMVQPNSLPR